MQGQHHCDRLPSPSCSSYVRILTPVCFREAIPASWYLYHSLDLKLLYTTTPGPLCEIASSLTNRRGSGLAINLPWWQQKKQHR